ncbi:hypothetical protein [Enterococcus durans]|uniref:Uncharacterized protein n=2 Tax=Enterococcus durans TaxID=53345 RepID=A0A377L8T2_9ENTE|nr:hypothetical protein [Enterococcus durans]HCB27572.1 hypothetical protein [Enterococcus sp.]EOT26194.1 hypothetical protein OMS_02892 [Enterococcus durans ATCC 6056]EOU22453.1 hypothetical protein I571_01020 [Enterococcus durans ATCC 6056]MDB1685644.1 hypothetical protein [Enterococcus durans]PEH45807.1 hypothetical protein CRM96_12690 [Enterococcus durans]
MESKFAKETVIMSRLQIMFSCLAIVSIPLFYGGYIAIWAPITLFFLVIFYLGLLIMKIKKG